MENTFANEIKSLQQKVANAYLRTTEAEYSRGIDTGGLESYWDEEHWELSLQLRELIQNAVPESENLRLVVTPVSEQTSKLMSVADFDGTQVVLYEKDVPTKQLSDYRLAENGAIQWLIPGEDAIYVV